MPKRSNYVRRRKSTRSRKYRRGNRKSLLRTRGRIRRSNTGSFNVNALMRSGNSLPQTAYGPCKTVITNQQQYLGGSPASGGHFTAPGQGLNDGRRTIVLSTLTTPYAWWQDPSLLQYIRAFGLFRLLYKRYIILGAKCKIRLTPGIWPLVPRAPVSSTGGNIWAQSDLSTSIDAVNQTWDMNAPASSSYPPSSSYPLQQVNPNGYWYVRVCTQGFDFTTGLPVSDPDQDIGHPMLTGYNGQIGTLGELQGVAPIWNSLANFLGDRTVAFSRDRKSWTVGVSENHKSNVAAEDVLPLSIYMEGKVGGRSPATVLTYRYSLRKLTKDKNYMRNDSPYWRSINDAPLSAPNQTTSMVFPRRETLIRYGYISFNPQTGNPDFHYPFATPFVAQTEIDYYCAWRDPVNINILNDPNLGGTQPLNATLTELSEKLRASQSPELFPTWDVLADELRNLEEGLARDTGVDELGVESMVGPITEFDSDLSEEEFSEPEPEPDVPRLKRPRLEDSKDSVQ